MILSISMITNRRACVLVDTAILQIVLRYEQNMIVSTTCQLVEKFQPESCIIAEQIPDRNASSWPLKHTLDIKYP